MTSPSQAFRFALVRLDRVPRVLRAVALASAMTLAGAGCGGADKPATKTPADESGGGESGGGEAGGGASNLAALAKPKKPERKISKEEKVDFANAVAVYQNMKKSGNLKGSGCKEAASAFERAAEQNPTLLEARFNQGQVLYECGMVDEAKKAWEMQTDGTRRFAPSLANLGFLAFKDKDTARAESYFARAIEADPKNVEARNNLAQILRDKARRSLTPEDKKQYISQAVNHLRAVLAVDAKNLQAYSTLAFIYYEMDYLEMSKLVADQAIARAQEIATGVNAEDKEEEAADDKGGKGGKGGKAKAAPKTKEKEVPAEKTVTEVKSASAMASSGYTPEMLKHIAITHNTKGLVALKKKDVSSALTNFKRAIELNPNLLEARMNLAAMSLNYRDYKTAEENFRAVVQAQPANFEATVGLGVALRGLKRIDDAEQQYAAAQKLDPGNPDSYFNMGLLYQDFKDNAKPTLQKAQGFYRDFLAKATDATSEARKKEANKRIKAIDELFVALEEAAKLQAEAEEMQRKAEIQQREMEQKLKEMEALEKQQQGAAGTAPPPPPAGDKDKRDGKK